VGVAPDEIEDLIARHRELAGVYDRAEGSTRRANPDGDRDLDARLLFHHVGEVRQARLAHRGGGDRIGRQITESSAVQKRQRQLELFAIALAALLCSAVAAG